LRKRRRQLIAAAGGVTVFGAAALLWRYWPQHGLINPCNTALPASLADHEAVRAAWDGIDATRAWDCHAHLIGNGDSGSGVWLNPDMHSLAPPVQFAQRLFFLNAGCAHASPGRVDESYIQRMHNLLDGMRPGCKLLLLAFDRHYSKEGKPLPDQKLIEGSLAPVLSAIREHNPLLFDFVLKRHLRLAAKRFATRVFETRSFFAP
jgi:uncharacterized protein